MRSPSPVLQQQHYFAPSPRGDRRVPSWRTPSPLARQPQIRRRRPATPRRLVTHRRFQVRNLPTPPRTPTPRRHPVRRHQNTYQNEQTYHHGHPIRRQFTPRRDPTYQRERVLRYRPYEYTQAGRNREWRNTRNDSYSQNDQSRERSKIIFSIEN